MAKEKDYTVLFIGDYFSLVGDVTTDKTDPDEIAQISLEFMKDYYGWETLEQVSKQITVRSCDSDEEWEVE